MIITEQTVSVQSLAQYFQKIYEGLPDEQRSVFDKEIRQMYPSPQSEVSVSSGYNEDDNSIGVSVYVSKPLREDEINPKNFGELMREYLHFSDTSRFVDIFECLQLMERQSGTDYEIDFIPVLYTQRLDSFYIHYRIKKL